MTAVARASWPRRVRGVRLSRYGYQRGKRGRSDTESGLSVRDERSFVADVCEGPSFLTSMGEG
jgi:hypothetical protein